MRLLLHSVSRACVVGGGEGGGTLSIGRGLSVTIGLSRDDTQADINYAVMRITGTRLWKRGAIEACGDVCGGAEEEKKWLNAVDLDLEILCHCSISLAGNVRNGSRLDVHHVMERKEAERWWGRLRDQVVRAYGKGGENRVKFAAFGCPEAVETAADVHGKVAWFDTALVEKVGKGGSRGGKCERFGIKPHKRPKLGTVDFAGDGEVSDKTGGIDREGERTSIFGAKSNPVHGEDDEKGMGAEESGVAHDDGAKGVEVEEDSEIDDDDTLPPERLRRAEAVLARRTARISLVLEYVSDSHNHSAILRTAEAMGIQDIYIVRPPGYGKGKDAHKESLDGKINMSSHRWLTLHRFHDTASCIKALKSVKGMQLWTTELGPDAVELTMANRPEVFPERVALVLGREMDGVSAAMKEACDKAVYLPMHGFSESLNVSVAAALVLQRIMDWCSTISGNASEGPRESFRGDLGQERVAQLRELWYDKLLSTALAKEKFGHWAKRGDEVARSALSDLRRKERPQSRGARWRSNQQETETLIQNDRAGQSLRLP